MPRRTGPMRFVFTVLVSVLTVVVVAACGSSSS
jgi:predicted small lipoprotein YifL